MRRFRNRLAKLITAERELRHLSAEQLGERVGVATKTEQHREAAHTSLTVEDLLRYCKEFRRTPTELLCDAEWDRAI